MKILDCTLRDGGYYNNWEFSRDFINQYLKVMNDIKIDLVEIGFRFVDKIKTKGPTAYCEESFIKSLKIPKKLKIGIMVNAADFIQSQDSILLAKKIFKPKKNL
jgi:4-hydroxy 2-oxovalerate aldolase